MRAIVWANGDTEAMIKVKEGTEYRDGSCSACHDRSMLPVCVVELWPSHQGISFRLCKKCKKELVVELRKMKL